ncbi:hypothetical protein IAU59_003471 [Kwoniella sp. CBS 9459]
MLPILPSPEGSHSQIDTRDPEDGYNSPGKFSGTTRDRSLDKAALAIGNKSPKGARDVALSEGRSDEIDVNSNECPSPVLRPARSSTKSSTIQIDESDDGGRPTVSGITLNQQDQAHQLPATPSIPALLLPDAAHTSPASPPLGSAGNASAAPQSPSQSPDIDASPQLVPTLIRDQPPLLSKNISISGSIPVSISGHRGSVPLLNGQELPFGSIPNSLRDLQSLSNSVACGTLRPRQDVLEYLGSMGNTTLRPPIGRLTTPGRPIALRSNSSSHSGTGSVTIMPGDILGNDDDDIAQRRQRREDEEAERERREAEMSFNSRMMQFERDLRAQTTEGRSSSGEEAEKDQDQDGAGGAAAAAAADGRANSVIVPRRIRRGESTNVQADSKSTTVNSGINEATAAGGARSGTGGIDEVEVEWCFFCGQEKPRSRVELKQVTLEQRKAMRARAMGSLDDDDDDNDDSDDDSQARPDFELNLGLGGHRDEQDENNNLGDQDRTRRNTNIEQRDKLSEKTWQWICVDGCGMDHHQVGVPM